MAKKAEKQAKPPRQKAEPRQPKASSAAAVAGALNKDCGAEDAQRILGIMCKATAHSSFLNKKLARVQKALDRLQKKEGA